MLTLNYEDLATYRNLVYVWFRDGEALYVGMSVKGLGRPLSGSHPYLRHFQPGDILTIYPASNPAAAERALIRQHRPRFNKAYSSRRLEVAAVQGQTGPGSGPGVRRRRAPRNVPRSVLSSFSPLVRELAAYLDPHWEQAQIAGERIRQARQRHEKAPSSAQAIRGPRAQYRRRTPESP